MAEINLESRVISAFSDADGNPLGGGRAIELQAMPFSGKIIVRGNSADAQFCGAILESTKLQIPTKPNAVFSREGAVAFWLGPDEWLLRFDEFGETAAAMASLKKSLAGIHSAAVEVSDYYAVLRIRGPHVREVLSAGCPLDLHPSAFEAGCCSQTRFSTAAILLYQVDDAPTFEVQVRWTFAEYLWKYFAAAAREFDEY